MLIRGLVAAVVGYVISVATWVGVASSMFGGGGAEPELRRLLFSFGALIVGAAVGGFAFTLIVGVANSPAIYMTIGVIAATLGRELYAGNTGAPNWYVLTAFLALAIGFMIGASTGAYRLDRR